MNLWWRRNGIPVVAIVLLLPATVVITFSNELGTYNESRATEVIVVDRADTVDYGDAEWSVINTERISSDSAAGIEAELPAGSDLVVVTTLVTPGTLDDEGKSPYCMVYLNELDGDTVSRTFTDSRFAAIDYSTRDTAVSYCDSGSADPYRLESVFVVPSDAGQSLALKLEVSDELPRFLQLRL